MVISMLLLVVLLFQFTSQAPMAEMWIASFVSGILAPFITQFIKNIALRGQSTDNPDPDKEKLYGRIALGISIAVSIGLSLIAVAITGEARTIKDYFYLAPWIFMQSTILFKVYKP